MEIIKWKKEKGKDNTPVVNWQSITFPYHEFGYIDKGRYVPCYEVIDIGDGETEDTVYMCNDSHVIISMPRFLLTDVPY